MPTLEERLQELESALSIMRSEHISDIAQLSERVDELQQQITEQQRRIAGQGQSMHQRFDTLEKALSQQFSQLEQQGRQQTDEIKAKFEVSDHFAARTWGLVQEQERDIRTVKEDVQGVSGRLDKMDRRFDTQDEKLNLILERLPKP